MKSIKLSSEGFSYHTFEVKWNPTRAQYMACKAALRKNSTSRQFYPLDKYGSGKYYCDLLRENGIRIYLSENGFASHHPYQIKLVVNPRLVIDPNASYLGIMPPDSESFEMLERRFTDCMRTIGLPEFLDDWIPTRLDLCVNILFSNKGAPKELLRMLYLDRLSAGCISKYSKESSPKYKKHTLELRSGDATFVVYDKLFQMKNENLIAKGEKLPKGVLRVELHCGRRWLLDYGKKNFMNHTTELLFALSYESREHICKYARKLFCGGTHYKWGGLKEELRWAPNKKKARQRLEDISRAVKNGRSLEQALCSLTEKQQRTALEKFKAIALNPIPLPDKFPLKTLPSLPLLLDTLEEDFCEIRLRRRRPLYYNFMTITPRFHDDDTGEFFVL